MATKRFSSAVELAGEVTFPDQAVLAQRFGLLAAGPEQIGLDPAFGDCRFGVLRLGGTEVPIVVPVEAEPPAGTCLVVGSLLAIAVQAISPSQRVATLPQAVVVAQRFSGPSQPKKTVSLVGQMGTRRIRWTRELYLAKGAAPLLVAPEGPVPKPGATVRIDGSVATYEVLRPWLSVTLLCVRGQIVELDTNGAPIRPVDADKKRSTHGAIDGARRAVLSLAVDAGPVPSGGGEGGEEAGDILGLEGNEQSLARAEEAGDELRLEGEEESPPEDGEEDVEISTPTSVEAPSLSAQEGWGDQ